MVASAKRGGEGNPPKKVTVAELIAFLDVNQMRPENRGDVTQVSDHYIQLQRVDRDRLNRHEREALHSRLREVGIFFQKVRAAKG